MCLKTTVLLLQSQYFLKLFYKIFLSRYHWTTKNITNSKYQNFYFQAHDKIATTISGRYEALVWSRLTAGILGSYLAEGDDIGVVLVVYYVDHLITRSYSPIVCVCVCVCVCVYIYIYIYIYIYRRARGSAVGWGTALQVGRSRVRFPMVSLEFFIDIILPASLWPWGWLSL